MYKSKKAWTIRLEPELIDKLKQISKKERRSLNQTCELLLAFAVDLHGRGQAFAGFLSLRPEKKQSNKNTHGNSLKDRQFDKSGPSRNSQPYTQGGTR